MMIKKTNNLFQSKLFYKIENSLINQFELDIEDLNLRGVDYKRVECIKVNKYNNEAIYLLEYCRQDLALDQSFSIEFFPETVTYLGLKQLFHREMKGFFNRYDSDRDGKLSFNDIQQFVQPRQLEYQCFLKKGGNYNRLIELIEIAEEYESYLIENIEKLEFQENYQISIKQFLSSKFKQPSEKDIWFLNQRFECYTIEDFLAYFEQYKKSN